MVRIDLQHLPEPRDRVFESTLKAGKLGLQKTDLGTVGGETAGRLDMRRRLGLVAEPDVHHRQVGPDGRLVRSQDRRPLELRLRIVEQPDFQGREPAVERAHRLAVLGRYLRGDAAGHLPAGGEAERRCDTAGREQSRYDRHSSHRFAGLGPPEGGGRGRRCRGQHDNRHARQRPRAGRMPVIERESGPSPGCPCGDRGLRGRRCRGGNPDPPSINAVERRRLPRRRRLPGELVGRRQSVPQAAIARLVVLRPPPQAYGSRARPAAGRPRPADYTSLSSARRPVLSPTRSAGTSSLPSSVR